MNEILNQIYPTLNTAFIAVLVAFIIYIGKEVVKLVPKLVDFVVAKIGLTNYQKTKAVAWDVWNLIEEHFRVSQIVGDTVQAKITMFETLIKQKLPSITDANIKLVRQAIAGEVNKDKPVILKAIEDPEKVAPVTIKYFAPDGITELVPIQPIV